MESLERQFGRIVHLKFLFDLAAHPLRDKDLAGLCFPTQASGEIAYGADRAIIASSLEADCAHRGVTVGNSDSKTQCVSALLPGGSQNANGVAHFACHADRRQPVSGNRDRIVEKYHYSVTGEMLNSALVSQDDS